MDLKSELMKVFIQYALVPIILALAGAVLAALSGLALYLHGLASKSKFALVGEKLTEFILSVASHLEAVERPLIQQASDDGVLTLEERKQMRDKAKEIVLQQAPADLIKQAKAASGPLFDTWISGLIERAVSQMPASTDSAPVAPSP